MVCVCVCDETISVICIVRVAQSVSGVKVGLTDRVKRTVRRRVVAIYCTRNDYVITGPCLAIVHLARGHLGGGKTKSAASALR